MPADPPRQREVYNYLAENYWKPADPGELVEDLLATHPPATTPATARGWVM